MIFFLREEVGVGHSSYIIALSAQDLVQRKRFSLALWTEMCQGRDGGSGWGSGVSEAATSCSSVCVCVCLQVSTCVHM